MNKPNLTTALPLAATLMMAAGCAPTMQQIMEQAAFVNLDSHQHQPDNAALSSRVLSLSREVYYEKQRVLKYQQLLIDIRQRVLDLKSPDEHQLLLQWLDEISIKLESA